MNNCDTIDQILDTYKEQLGVSFQQYRNHVYRIFLLTQKFDNNVDNMEKYAIGAAFHDIGIWSHPTFDYIEPSIAEANRYLLSKDKKHWIEEITLMIDNHHKRSPYIGIYQTTVETFRKADWIDVTMGIMKFNLNNKDIKETTTQYPTIGFHRFLIKESIKYFFKSPLNPLPMFKK